MKKRIICVILSLVAVFSLVGFHATEAWFGSGENKSMQLSSGDLNFTATGDLTLKNKNALILPGAELELKQAIVITNLSTIDTELRVRVECTYEIEEGVTSQPFTWIEFVNDDDSKWYADPEDGCIYYTPKAVPGDDRRIPGVDIEVTETTTVAETTTEAETEAGETTTDGGAEADDEVTEITTETTTETTTRVYADNEIPLAGTIIISGDVPYELQGKALKLNFIIEAKQADFMKWENFNNPNGMPTTVPTTVPASEETSE